MYLDVLKSEEERLSIASLADESLKAFNRFFISSTVDFSSNATVKTSPSPPKLNPSSNAFERMAEALSDFIDTVSKNLV